jgi:hypothetical protein
MEYEYAAPLAFVPDKVDDAVTGLDAKEEYRLELNPMAWAIT